MCELHKTVSYRRLLGGGKASIIEERCINCRECIRRCPSHAKSAITDVLLDLKQYKYNVALPAPALYGQFGSDVSVSQILAGLIELGFDDVLDAAVGAEIVSSITKRYLEKGMLKKPAISSACPAVVRFIQVKFPELIEHIVPFEAPMEVAARLVRAEAARVTKLEQELMGVWFITPCPAKMTAVRQPIAADNSNITGVIAISQIYGELLKCINNTKRKHSGCRPSWHGLGWCAAGGETKSLDINKVIVVHEIHNVGELLEQVALGKLNDIDYIECLACAGRCIGGPLTVENRFVAEKRISERIADIKKEPRELGISLTCEEEEDALVLVKGAIQARPLMKLDEDIVKAMCKVELIESTLNKLPGLDCGSCGSPNCKALAEDIVQGKANETDCMFKLRERVSDLAQKMADLAQKLPPSLRVPLDDDDENNMFQKNFG